MDTQLIAFLMFLLLTYLLFRRPASAASKRLPTELNLQIGHSVKLKGETLKEKSAPLHGWNGVSKSFLRRSALWLFLISLLSVFATAQSPANAQARLAAGDNIPRSGKENELEGLCSI